MTQLNISKYTKVPQIGVRSGLALGIALGSALPDSAPEAVKTAASKVTSKVAALQQSWGVQHDLEASANSLEARQTDLRVDRAWRSAYDTLKGVGAMHGSPRVDTAKRLNALLFAGGLSFLKLPFKEQWAECDWLLEKLSDEAVAAEFNGVLGGPECLTELRAAHQAYGRALDITGAAEAPPDPGLALALRELRDAISAYTVQVLAWSQTSEENEQLARKALLPIDARRATNARSKAQAGDSPAEPEPAAAAVNPATPPAVPAASTT